MWPFSKKKTQADQAIEVMDSAIAEVAAKYRLFSDKLPFTDGMVRERLTAFVPAMEDGLKQNYPVLQSSPSDVLMLYVLIGVARSGLHTNSEIAEAMDMEVSFLESLVL